VVAALDGISRIVNWSIASCVRLRRHRESSRMLTWRNRFRAPEGPL
jgi:hypothetical protein